jgi:IS30 family transposase
MRWEGKGPSEIARVLNRDKGTISRELSGNASSEYHCYTPCRAQRRYDQRKLTVRHSRPLLKSKKIQQYVRQKLKINWSPEIIVGRLKKEMPSQSISPEAIYQFIYHQGDQEGHVFLLEFRRGAATDVVLSMFSQIAKWRNTAS